MIKLISEDDKVVEFIEVRVSFLFEFRSALSFVPL